MVERIDQTSVHWARLHADHVARYLYAARHVEGKRVLDAGTGTGYGAAILKASGAATVQAVDISPDAIAEATKQFGPSGVSYFVDDCETLRNVEGPFDVICNFENIEHLQKPEEFLKSAARLLARDGKLFCSTPDRAATPPFQGGMPANPHHVTEWYRDDFKQLLERFFRAVDFRVQVVTHGYDARRRAAELLLAEMHVIRRLPVYQLRRFWRWLRGQSNDWTPTFDLLAADVEDFPIHPLGLDRFLGKPWCHFAMCSRANGVLQGPDERPDTHAGP
jgi:2-polyprenyl-3-methyl-5-hydroxy-6-metoxy-1,4-benzoquinol methylase